MHIIQILHTTVLDIRIYYYPRNAIFHEAEGRVEYCIPRVVINLISNTVACNICFIILFRTSGSSAIQYKLQCYTSQLSLREHTYITVQLLLMILTLQL